MIMADKIIEQRKKNGWSQEELAEQLKVSRQSVSKWEGAQSIPDLNKVIAMASLFGVTTDYLLKDDMEELPAAEPADGTGTPAADETRWVSLEESNSFLSVTKQASGQIALGVFLCIFSPVFVILLASAGASGCIPLTEDQGGMIGSVILMLIISCAVALFVKNGMQLSKYEYLEQEPIDTEYGVTGMVKERKAEYEHAHLVGMVGGIMLCVLSSVPLIAASLAEESKKMMLAGAGFSLTLIMVAIGVYLIVRVSIVWGGYQRLLEEGDYSRKTKRARNGILGGIYWSVVTAAFLGYSFYTGDWFRSWMIWPVAGVLYAAVAKVEEYLAQRRQI